MSRDAMLMLATTPGGMGGRFENATNFHVALPTLPGADM